MTSTTSVFALDIEEGGLPTATVTVSTTLEQEGNWEPVAIDGESGEALCATMRPSRPRPASDLGLVNGTAAAERLRGLLWGLCAPLRAVRCRSVRQRAASVRTSTSGKCRYNRRLAIGLERARFRVRVLIELSDDEAVAAAVMLPMVAADRLAPNASSHTGGAFKRNGRGVI